jgi:hypothetical protein
MTQAEYRSEITLNERGKEVIRVDEEGFHYNGQFIADAGEAHRLMVAFLKQNTAQPEQKVPTAWMYQGEADFDGEHWRENWQVTLDEKLARFKSGDKEPVPLWNRPAIESEVYYEFSVLNDEYCTEAGGTAPTLSQAIDEGKRYFAHYSQDGLYTLEVRRVEIIPAPY